MQSTLDIEIRKLYKRLLDTPDDDLPPDELMMKRDRIRHLNWQDARFNDDAEPVRNENGAIIAEKGAWKNGK